ncbi:MAG: hypothetical protein DHS20C11_01260 [Lysobacteraceae bacterium]|nr:MAG: hypothetical protein DHS20C11_01260 [Xanthomonadaceae bacterium]
MDFDTTRLSNSLIALALALLVAALPTGVAAAQDHDNAEDEYDIVGTDAAGNPIEAPDTSKPTNLFSSFGHNLEYTEAAGTDIWGYRGNLQWAPNPENLVLVELPLLRNESTGKTGIGDTRLRYFNILWKDYSQFFGAFALSVDTVLPTGDIDDGLGSDRAVIAPAVAGGLMIAPWIQTFPIVSYVYTDSTDSLLVPEASRGSLHGYSIQAITPIVVSDKVWLSYTPIYLKADSKLPSTFSHELLLNYTLSPKHQLQFFLRDSPDTDTQSFRLTFRSFF